MRMLLLSLFSAALLASALGAKVITTSKGIITLLQYQITDGFYYVQILNNISAGCKLQKTNSNCPGNDLLGLPGNGYTYAQCEAACLADATCAGFSFGMSMMAIPRNREDPTFECILKSAVKKCNTDDHWDTYTCTHTKGKNPNHLDS